MKPNITTEIICFLLITLFVYAALSKLFDYPSFNQQLKQSPLPSAFSNFAWIIPAAELLTSISLIFGAWRQAGLYASFFLMLCFTVYIAAMLVFTKHLPCSCGGVLKQLTWKQHLLFNLFFLILAGTGIIIERKSSLKNIVAQQF